MINSDLFPQKLVSELTGEIQEKIRRRTSGELRTDPKSRWLYSTDASLYQMQPIGVFFPQNKEDLLGLIEICRQHQIAVTPRGGGSSLAGQAIGPGIILDLSRYLDKKLQIDPEKRTAILDPGVTLTHLNQAARKYGLMFGPDPASADRATVGGSVANNATGAHSILYGMAADHVNSAEVIFADGTAGVLGPTGISHAQELGDHPNPTALHRFYRLAVKIRTESGALIRQRWPRVWRRSSGYGLNYLLPWSPDSPPQWHATWNDRQIAYPPVDADEINLAMLLAGSEGTLGIITALELRLVPLPAVTRLGVLAFESIHAACDAAPELLGMNPSAIELIPGTMIQLARSVPAYAHQLGFVRGEPEALLVIEFSGENGADLSRKIRRIAKDIQVAETTQEQAQVWNIRKMGLGILNSRPGDEKPLAFIEDLAVPVDSLGIFTREMARIMAAHGTYAEFYAHASAGCLHIRPVMSLKSANGVSQMRSIARQAVELAIGLGGAVSGEHGDGIARSEWMTAAYGAEIVRLFEDLKFTVDPDGLLNPGKKVNPPKMDHHLRYHERYTASVWNSPLDFASQAGLDGAIEMCNGAGVCRKTDGLMCPSFQVTREEEHSTRGRANLLRAYLTGGSPVSPDRLGDAGARAVYAALDLCLACKGCKAECPSAVDVAKLKYAFLEHYYQTRPRKKRDYLFANIGRLAQWGSPFAELINRLLVPATVRGLGARIFGLAPERKLPELAGTGLLSEASELRNTINRASSERPQVGGVLLLSDSFSRYFHPETEIAALQILQAAGIPVFVLDTLGAGRTALSKGFLHQARETLRELIDEIQQMDPAGELPVVGIEPSEIYTLRDELPDFFPQDSQADKLSKRAWMVEEFLLRPDRFGRRPVDRLVGRGEVATLDIYLHGHCYQKAQPPAADGFPVGTTASQQLLEHFGGRVTVIPSGCCGMAGAFGYESEHYQTSVAVGELTLLPTVRSAPSTAWIAAAGTSCRSQIKDGTGRQAYHPLEIASRLGGLTT
jgi:FAD/FMN-containing dehydrogenase/Fe-S oxidoreductase